MKYCPAKDAKCHKCSKTGHFGAMCLTKKHIGAVHDADGSDADCAFLGSIHSQNKQSKISAIKRSFWESCENNQGSPEEERGPV